LQLNILLKTIFFFSNQNQTPLICCFRENQKD